MAMVSAVQEAQKDNLKNFNDYMMTVLEVSELGRMDFHIGVLLLVFFFFWVNDNVSLSCCVVNFEAFWDTLVGGLAEGKKKLPSESESDFNIA